MKMIMEKILLTLLFGGLFFGLMGQEITGTDLPFDRLGQSDIEIKDQQQNSQQVLSASRTLQSVDELPFTIYVVTREEIFKNSYTTLVDVLKTVPGIRVSQPGSALEGETFVMRGLLGNGYTKILVNDLPVKPIVVSGMPIGAQLPIKEAERIEIIFGPGASIYGADASAGVINIITSQTERPIYAQADLSIGSNDYTHLSVMFGGKIGKGKRILKFSMYGSSTEFNDRNIPTDDPSIFGPGPYALEGDTSYLDNPNFIGNRRSILVNNLPHASKALGIQLKYRSLNFSFSRMYRRDHSALGLNPLAVAYSDPGTFTGETINTVNFGFNKRKRIWGMTTNLTYIGHEMDRESSTLYVDNSLSQVLKFYVNTALDPFPTIRDSVLNDNFDRFFSGRRYQYAASNEIRLEQLINIKPSKNLEAIFGATLQGSFYQPYINYLRSPFQSELVEFTENGTSTTFVPIFTGDNLEGSLGLFTQWYLTLKKLNVIAGIRYDAFSDFGKTINPRLGFLYKMGSRFSTYGSVATAFRAPSPFYGANTYLISINDFTDFMTNPVKVLPEKTRTIDLGIRSRPSEKVKLDVTFYLSQTTNFISPFFQLQTNDPSDFSAIFGYSNDELSEVLLYGTQARVQWDDLWPFWDLDIDLSVNYNEGREILPFGSGRLDGIRMQPKFSGQLQISFELLNRFYVHMNSVFAGPWNNRSFTKEPVNALPLPVGRQDQSLGYYTMDVMGRLQLSSSFHAFLKVKNIFNAYYGGIGATGTLDDLITNRQPTSTLQMGMSYRMQ